MGAQKRGSKYNEQVYNTITDISLSLDSRHGLQDVDPLPGFEIYLSKRSLGQDLRCLTRLVKNVGKGPWGILEAMEDDRPMDRFWFGALSGTIVNANSSGIAGPMSIIGSEA